MLNQIIIMGRLTRDPESKGTASGISAATFTLACERDYAPQGQERDVDFIDCIAWRGTAEFVLRNFAKGRMLAVEGRLQINTWTANDGSKRKNPQIIVERVYFADSKPKEEAQAPVEGGSFGTEVDVPELPF